MNWVQNPGVTLAVPVAWFAAGVAFQRVQRRNTGRQAALTVKGKMPTWLRIAEKGVFFAILGILALILLVACAVIYEKFHPLRGFGSATALSDMLFAISSLIAATPLSFLLANMVSWFVPRMRNGNLLAMGEDYSFAMANRGLVIMELCILPICLAQIALGVWEPWAN